MSIPSFTLNTGAKIPAIGLGTWKSAPGEVTAAVKAALQCGYRHIDCAFAYGNEAEVGQGIKEAGVPREQIFITSKLWSTYHNDVEAGLDASLKELGIDYVDLYLVHWPIALNPKGNDPKFPTLPDGSRDIVWDQSYSDTWKGMEAVYKKGKAKAIGVSNMSVPKLERLLKDAEVVPAANQIELHPLCPQDETVTFCQEKGILPQAYSPLGSTESPILKDEHLAKIADKLNCSVSNVLISYQVQRGVCVLPKSVTPSRIQQNLKIVKLDDDDFKFISQMHGGKVHRFVRPNWEPFKMEFPDWP